MSDWEYATSYDWDDIKLQDGVYTPTEASKDHQRVIAYAQM